MTTQIPPLVHTFPATAVLIGCGSVAKPNLITCSWFGTVCSEPPMVSVSIRDNRFSYPLVHDSWEFTVNIPRVSDLELIKYCGTKSGRDVNKFEQFGLTAALAEPLEQAPMIANFPLVLACKVRHELKLGTHYVFIAEVMAIHADEKLVRPSQRPDPFCTDQLVYLDGRYWRLAPV